jgi:hypothetical protein
MHLKISVNGLDEEQTVQTCVRATDRYLVSEEHININSLDPESDTHPQPK